MGNRAVITTKERDLALYLHWNGGRDTVEPLLKYCELQGYRPPSADSYGWARMAQVMGNFFGGSLSVGIDLFKRLRDQGDNGVYVIDGWKVAEHIAFDYDSDYNVLGWREVGPSGELPEARVQDMLRTFDAAMPEELRLGEFLDADEVPVGDVEVGDEVWMRTVGGKWEAFPVIGKGQPEFNRIAVTVDAPDGKRDVSYPDLPYVAMYDHDGDFSWNCNNYVHGSTARIKPRG